MACLRLEPLSFTLSFRAGFCFNNRFINLLNGDIEKAMLGLEEDKQQQMLNLLGDFIACQTVIFTDEFSIPFHIF
jgi:hypothetical protein